MALASSRPRADGPPQTMFARTDGWQPRHLEGWSRRVADRDHGLAVRGWTVARLSRPEVQWPASADESRPTGRLSPPGGASLAPGWPQSDDRSGLLDESLVPPRADEPEDKLSETQIARARMVQATAWRRRVDARARSAGCTGYQVVDLDDGSSPARAPMDPTGPVLASACRPALRTSLPCWRG